MKDLYGNQYEPENYSADYEEVLSQMHQLDKKLHKLKKKRKGAKHGKKQKLKRRMKAIELQYEQLKQFTVFLAYQYKAQPNQQNWWQDVLCSSVPKALELLTATVNNLPAKNQQLYITDGSKQK